jgi:hypothetical protein
MTASKCGNLATFSKSLKVKYLCLGCHIDQMGAAIQLHVGKKFRFIYYSINIVVFTNGEEEKQ